MRIASIDHSALLNKLKVKGKVYRQIKAWLKAGVIDNEVFSKTNQGTPQGGVISPLLANIALHGLDEHLMLFARNSKGWKYKSGVLMGRRDREQSLTFIRYADDFVVLHNSKDVILECKNIISEWLKGIGLELKPSKTRMTHTLLNEESEDGKAGFDFLGFHIQQYEAGIHNDSLSQKGKHHGFKSLITPSRKALTKHQASIKAAIKEHEKSPQAALILKLNPIIQGWTNYYRFSDVKTTGILSKQKDLTHWKLRRWGVRRCESDQKSVNNYFHKDKSKRWVFSTREGNTSLKLINYCDTHCSSTEYVKVKGTRSPYDGEWLYWCSRMGNYSGISPSVATLLKKQKGKCAHCGQYFRENDVMEIDHIIPKSQEGSNKYDNRQLLHGHCHDSKTAQDNKTLADSKLKAKQLRDNIEQRWLDGETNFTEEEKVILNEILQKRYEGLEPTEAFYDHTTIGKRKKSPKGSKTSKEKQPKARKPKRYIKGRRIKTQEAPKVAR